ncbi:MAG: nitrogen fixation protein [Methanobacterium sp.]|jgi:predicted Fe-Mo cluster-binding NifX family protein|uniref:NifB/NifX family molybdenum-iron cluster-binding protein n=1 Tax=Methanobacterium sp. TaxID=2164 RepID=UPI00258BFA35|nr:NifB/NifX family molybdenum-iron cluster-binding protein [Methanobacterium sp.]MCC7560601.1 nitrogen fixation protein [Methanobacterium sp.]
MKIAVASSDGKTVDQHFGQAWHFLIFQIGKEGLEFIELRKKSKKPVYDHEYRWKRGLDILRDCKVIFCRRIGDEPRKELNKLGIEVVESKKETIPDAITQYLTSMINGIKLDAKSEQ